MNYLSSSDDDDSSSDDDDDEQPVNAIAVDPRPLKPGDWRFKVGDVLLFRRDFFNAQPGGLNGPEAPQMRRGRSGIIRTRTRERPRGANRGQYLYTVLFNDPATTVPRLPLDNDVDATFLAETYKSVSTAWIAASRTSRHKMGGIVAHNCRFILSYP